MAKTKDKPVYDSIDASPVKSFFVNMLTRDIRLEEAILDLLDNCVDGVLRNHKTKSTKSPFEGFWAHINFSGSSFSISDNCGGIPWSLHDYAFRMGRSSERLEKTSGTVGVYGIGMKRAIFKIGQNAVISTQNDQHRYDVEIKPSWMGQEEEWDLPVKASARKMKSDGTEIVVNNLHDRIASTFGKNGKAFKGELEKMIATHYAFLIEKGFEVKINGAVVKPHPTKLVFNKRPIGKSSDVIHPFIWEGEIDGVEIFLAVGFWRPLPSQEELDSEQEQPKYTSLEAGWTVVCNDRAVLYCDRTELTGWGEAGVPRYHTQFISIAGVVEFKSDDPSKLPTTTTKRGIDASSRLYLQVKNKMREGTRLFTDYTNKWKNHLEEAKGQIGSGEAMSIGELRTQAKNLSFTRTRKTAVPGRQYTPKLPMPPSKSSKIRRIAYIKNVDEIREVSEYLFSDSDQDASEVGERCFDIVAKEARK